MRAHHSHECRDCGGDIEHDVTDEECDREGLDPFHEDYGQTCDEPMTKQEWNCWK